MAKTVARKFGEKLFLAAFSVKGKLSKSVCEKLTDTIVSSIKLQCIPGRIFYSYPYDGSGGNGFTLIQPITESFIAIDQWEDFNGGYIIICSCKFFESKDIGNILKEYNLKILSNKFFTLDLGEK